VSSVRLSFFLAEFLAQIIQQVWLGIIHHHHQYEEEELRLRR